MIQSLRLLAALVLAATGLHAEYAPLLFETPLGAALEAAEQSLRALTKSPSSRDD